MSAGNITLGSSLVCGIASSVLKPLSLTPSPLGDFAGVGTALIMSPFLEKQMCFPRAAGTLSEADHWRH